MKVSFKRLFMCASVFALVFMTAFAYGLDLQAGVDTEIIVNKQLELDKTGIDVDYSAQFYDVCTEIKIGDAITITPKIGINHSKLENSDVALGGINLGSVDLDSGIGWNIGLDVQADVLTTDVADLSLIGSYRFARTDIDTININGLEFDNPIEAVLYTHQWELGAMVSKDLSQIVQLQEYVKVPLTPYVGIVYSDLRGNLDVNLSALTAFDLKEDIKAKDNFGLRLGLRIEPKQDLYIDFGMKLIDETTISGQVTLKF